MNIQDAALKSAMKSLKSNGCTDFQFFRPDGGAVTKQIVSFSCAFQNKRIACFYDGGRVVIAPDDTEDLIKMMV